MQPNRRLTTGKAHAIRLVPGSWLHRLAGASEIAVNSLHNQGIDRLAPGLIAEGVAPDGLIEAVRANSAGFVIGVQWHPEYDWERDPLSRHIFEAFGEAVRERGQAAVASAAN
jgi:putative glutamine amidotransferase